MAKSMKKVAKRVVEKTHVLEVDGKRYDLTVAAHPGGLDQDKIIIHLSATVDYSQLPASARKTLKGLKKDHPDVHVNHNSNLELCTLSGGYSTVQAALGQLLGQNGLPKSTTENKEPQTCDENTPNPPTPLPHTQVMHDQSRSQKDKKERPFVEKHATSLQREITPGGYDWELQGATASPPEPEEDFSLMVDADTFRYLQKYCREKYYHILKKHGVAVVDYSHEGLTTLLLQIASGDGADGQECLREARKEISQLYEESQANICRDKLLKAILPGRANLKRAVDKLSSKLAKLIFSEDEQNIYIIGSREDVSEAKRFLLLHDDSDMEKPNVTSPRRFQDSWPGNETKAPVVSVGVLESNGVDKEKDDTKMEGSPKLKLAAQFKDPHLPPMGSKASSFTIRGHQQSNHKKHLGPMVAHDVRSEATKNAYVNAQNTGGDILFKSGDVTMQNTTRPKTSTASAIQSDSLDAQTKSTASLRRTSSFSGVQKKDQDNSPKSDTEKGKGRGRSSSFSTRQEQHTVEITVDGVIWLHIIKAYKPRFEELVSGIQWRERNSKGDRNTTVLLTGTKGSEVLACQQGLQKLIDSVSIDFICIHLSLQDLGVTDETDETLLACYTEIRSRYKKISMEIANKNVFILGPTNLCSQVSNLLLEVFSGAQVSPGQQDYSQPSTSRGSEAFRNSPNGQIGKVNGSTGHVSPRKDAVIQEKLSRSAGLGLDGQDVQESIKNGAVTTRNDKTKSNRQQTTAATEGLECMYCDKAGPTVKRTKCLLTMCSSCNEFLHVQCLTCDQREDREACCINGNMTYATLPMSLPGHTRDPVVKITYSIPDGIQAEGHPSPGEFFTGGTFEAFLPDCEQTRRLLPRLNEAFKRGHTFTVRQGRVQWDSIQHKTSMHGGKPTGYPDSSYLSHLSDVLTALRIP
ncbi:uncharacterized protein [Eucyclogobius newberryi]|uniref:uncharacterized protein n=1 Tax=Eucyclogobius newberryi TaxID=166745 RepID=UPI003B596290